MKKIIGGIVCYFMGHERGKRVATRQLDKVNDRAPVEAVYQCPRCTATWRRKVKAA